MMKEVHAGVRFLKEPAPGAAEDMAAIEKRVRSIIEEVRSNGDDGLRRFRRGKRAFEFVGNDQNHHAATYLPYDGAGFWRGNIPRSALYHASFDSIRMGALTRLARASDGPGEFLFSTGGMAVLNLGADHPPGLAVTDQLSTLRYFPLDPKTGAPGRMRSFRSR